MLLMPYVYSPFRYPGGKSQLYDFIQYLININKIDGTYVEPFAGGAGLAIKLLINNKVRRIWINDYDKSIYSVWHAILYHPYILISLIKRIPFDYENGSIESSYEDINYWNKVKKSYWINKNYQNSLRNAFNTLFLNRTNVSGIIDGGPIGGKSQRGTNKIYARLNKRTLIHKILKIYSYRDRVVITRFDALKFIPHIYKCCDLNNTLVFIDPPYFNQGKNLYMSFFNKKEHLMLSRLILRQHHMRWITTYDNSNEILKFYFKAPQRFKYLISYTANNKNRGKFYELMFASKNLSMKSYDNVNLKKLSH